MTTAAPALYQVADWNMRYENNRSREIDRCAYLSAPNDQGPVFYAISGNANGEAIFGVWFAIICLCAPRSWRTCGKFHRQTCAERYSSCRIGG